MGEGGGPKIPERGAQLKKKLFLRLDNIVADLYKLRFELFVIKLNGVYLLMIIW